MPGRFLPCCFAALLFSITAATAESFEVRLSPGPRLVGTRAEHSGSGHITATLDGSKLTIAGSYDGLLGAPTGAHLFMGSAPGVRGPKLADLTISAAASGSLSGAVTLTKVQRAAFAKGGLYVEIDSADAPDGDLWGWLMPPAD
jgi:hypothetical protein